MVDKKEKTSTDDKLRIVALGTTGTAALGFLGATVGGAFDTKQSLPVYPNPTDEVACVRTINKKTKILSDADAIAEFRKQKALEQEQRDPEINRVEEENKKHNKFAITGLIAGTAAIPVALGAAATAGYFMRKEKEKTEAAQGQENSRT